MATDAHHRTGNSMMVMQTGAGWQRGLNNVLHAELQHWFGTRMWLWQILIWAMCVNFIFLMVALTARNAPSAEALPESEALMIFCIFLGLAGPIGVSIMMQSAVVGEKRSGTAAWVLSKPVSRDAFILSKLFANSLGIAVTMVLVQGIIAYMISGLVLDSWPEVGGFLAGLGVLYINILFYLTLTLMLGAIFEHPAPVIGIPLAFLFFQQYLIGFYPPLGNILPWTLAVPTNGSQAMSLSMALMNGAPLPSLMPLISAIIFCILFTAVALVVFSRKEL